MRGRVMDLNYNKKNRRFPEEKQYSQNRWNLTVLEPKKKILISRSTRNSIIKTVTIFMFSRTYAPDNYSRFHSTTVSERDKCTEQIYVSEIWKMEDDFEHSFPHLLRASLNN